MQTLTVDVRLTNGIRVSVSRQDVKVSNALAAKIAKLGDSGIATDVTEQILALCGEKRTVKTKAPPSRASGKK